jgi:hypothetical protein
MLRWILVAVLSLTVVGAAWACDSAKNASASTKSSCGSKATKTETVQAQDDCKYCDLMVALHKNSEKVTFSATEDKDGMTLVFAANSEEDVVLAQQLASDAYGLMAGPAHCDYTRSAMAKKSCGDCTDGVNAFAGTEVTLEDTDEGAWAKVSAKDKKQVEKLHTFFANLHEHEEDEG